MRLFSVTETSVPQGTATLAQAPFAASRRRPRRRWLLWALAAGVVVVLVLTAWVGVRAMQARAALTTALAQVQQLQSAMRAGDEPAARTALTDLRETTQRGRDLTSDPVWTVATLVPWVGPNLAAVTTVAAGVDDLADLALPAVLETAGAMDLSALAPVNGRIDLAPLVEAGPLVAEASDAAATVDRDVAAIRTEDLLAAVARPVAEAQGRVHELAATLRTAERATVLLPPMLGVDGPRRYLLLLQTNAELRATGGLPGSISVITADDGRVELVEQVPASGMPAYDEPVLELTDDDEALYSTRLGRYMGDVNLVPHFPTAAELTVEMWRRHTGQAVDGVLATDPVALSYLLDATGPVADGFGGELTAANAVDVLLSGVYATVPDADQNDFFAAAAANVFVALVGGTADPAATVPALGRAAAEHRLLVWSSHEDERAELAGTVLAGTMPSGPDAAASVGVFFNDGTASKMDYYLDTVIEPVRAGCETSDPTYTVRIAMANRAPLDAAATLPAAVTGPGRSGVVAGGIRTNVVLLGPPSGRIDAVRRDGNPIGVGSYAQHGRPASVVTIELVPGEETVLLVEMVSPDRGDLLQVWSTPTKDQPGYRALPSTCAT